MKAHNGMRPQDVVVLLKIAACAGDDWRQTDLAHDLFVSQSEVSESLSRSAVGGLIDAAKRSLHRKALVDFLTHGLRYVFPVQPGPLVRGMATAHSAPPLSLSVRGASDVLVWPYDDGRARGQAIAPLYPAVPRAAARDEKLYELLALVDAVRVGRARESSLACRKIQEALAR